MKLRALVNHRQEEDWLAQLDRRDFVTGSAAGTVERSPETAFAANNVGLTVCSVLRIRKARDEHSARALMKVEDTGLEPVTFWLPAKRSPN